MGRKFLPNIKPFQKYLVPTDLESLDLPSSFQVDWLIHAIKNNGSHPCLLFGLLLHQVNRDTRLFYDGDHVIVFIDGCFFDCNSFTDISVDNIPVSYKPLENYGLSHVLRSFFSLDRPCQFMVRQYFGDRAI